MGGRYFFHERVMHSFNRGLFETGIKLQMNSQFHVFVGLRPVMYPMIGDDIRPMLHVDYFIGAFGKFSEFPEWNVIPQGVGFECFH